MLKNFIYIIKYIIINSPLYLIYNIFWAILYSFSQLINLFFLPYILRLIEQNVSINYIISFLFIVFLFRLIVDFFMAYMNMNYVPKAELDLQKKIQSQLFNKAVNVDLSKYDDPDFYNEFIIINSEMDVSILKIVNNIRTIIYSLLISFSTITIILNLDIFSIIFVIISLILSYFMSSKGNTLVYNRDIERKYFNRKLSYINRVFYFREYAKEVRLSDISNKLIEDCRDCLKNIKNINIKYGYKLLILNFINSYLLNTLIYTGILNLYLIYKVLVLKTITISTFFALYTAIRYVYSDLWNILMLFPEFKRYNGYIDKFKTFMECETNIVNSNSTLELPSRFESLELKNVSFFYTKDNYILKNINLSIKRNEKIALVGHNGAGKSTLVKLILRLYEVREGEIKYNNCSIKDFDLKKYRGEFGVVLQDFKLFSTSLAENVVMDIFQENLYDDVMEALNLAGLGDKIEIFEKGIETVLYKEFDNDGILLSGGEEQKLAISRIFIRDFEVIIMDEPTSALDPIAEYKLNKIILEKFKDKTVIFISHRLLSVTIADKIYMLEKGEVVEQGTHKELLNLNGKYAELFMSQALKYKKEGEK